MCLNLQTSLVAFGLGELAGLYLATRNSIEKKLVGLFVMFYSLVQLFEAFIYYHGESADEIYSKLLLLNLGFQGLVFFVLMSQAYAINNFYLVVSAIISFGIIIYSMSSVFSKVEIKSNCLRWPFLENKFINIPLSIMYLLIFFWILNDKETISNNVSDTNYVGNCGIVLIITFLFSNLVTFNCNKPGMWCLTSAISAPIFTLL